MPKSAIVPRESASKRASKYYHYYHCNSSCDCRYRDDNRNKLFIMELKNYPRPEMRNCIKLLLRIYIRNVIAKFNKKNKEIIVKCGELKNVISATRRKLMKEEIDTKDFKIIKIDCEKEICYLESKLTSSSVNRSLRIQ